jgi:hypothetical protein
MGDTYASAGETEADRAQRHALLAALNVTKQALHRDECGAWRINGCNDWRGGSIHTWGEARRGPCSSPAARPSIGPEPGIVLDSSFRGSRVHRARFLRRFRSSRHLLN